MDQNNQPPVDPLQQFSNIQPQPEEYVFNGQRWPNKEAAEAAYNQHLGKLSAEREELEKRAQQAQAAPQQNAASQYVTGREPETYNHATYLSYLGEDGRKAQAYAAQWEITNPTSQYGLLMRALIQKTQAAEAKLTDMEMRQAHPEINWNDPKTRELIEIERRNRGYNSDINGSEATIAMLQRERRLPTPEEYQQRMWAASQQTQQQGQPFYSSSNTNLYQMPPQQAQQAPYPNSAPPPFGRGYATASFDENAALAKMQDPDTPIEEVRRIGAALAALGRNPTSAVG